MNITDILSDKRNNSTYIKEQFGLLKKHKPLGLILISDDSVSLELVEGLKVIAGCFVVVNKTATQETLDNKISIVNTFDMSLLSGFDFVVVDDNIEGILDFAHKGIAPIIIRNNHLGSLFKEFNPLKNEGNSFFYEELNSWSIFYTIVRYLENYKFPFDNKNLVKNVLSI